MIVVLCLILVTAVVVGALFVRGHREQERVPRTKSYYQGVVTNEDRHREIDEAVDETDINTMIDAWSERGMSTEGMLYARLLEARAEIVGQLNEEDARVIAAANAAAELGAKMPPVTGRGRM